MTSILIADDNLVLLKALSRQLKNKHADWAVATASNGYEAIKLARDTSFDLVITDILMPERDGFETISEIRKLAPATKFIAMSGAGDLEGVSYLHVASRLGAHEILVKPFTSEDIFAAIERVLESTVPIAPLPASPTEQAVASKSRNTAS